MNKSTNAISQILKYSTKSRCPEIKRRWNHLKANLFWPPQLTYVSSKHSQNVLFSESWGRSWKQFLKSFFTHIFRHNFWRTFNFYTYLTNITFDLITKLRARLRYQLSSDLHSHKYFIKCPNKSPFYIVWTRFI